MPGGACAGEIFVTNRDGTIGEYTTSGATINAALVTGAGISDGIAVSGNELFVTTLHDANADPNSGTIGVYDATTGAPINTSLVTGLAAPDGVLVSGGNLYVANSDGDNAPSTIGEYTTSGDVINASLVSGLRGPSGLALSGNDLFVTDEGNTGFKGTIGEYDATTGATINASLANTGNGTELAFDAISGVDIFVVNFNAGTIGEYTTSGATVNASLVTGLEGNPIGVAVSGGDLFAVRQDQFTAQYYIGEYNATTGAAINASLISGLVDFPTGIVIVPTPEPATWIMLAIGAAALAARGLRKRCWQR
jgi:hypothetical protein